MMTCKIFGHFRTKLFHANALARIPGRLPEAIAEYLAALRLVQIISNLQPVGSALLRRERGSADPANPSTNSPRHAYVSICA